MWKDFKQFAMRGNVLDLAVGVVMGAAFNKIVTSLVNDIIMPIVSRIIGRVNFTSITLPLGGDAVLGIGSFIQNIVDFVIVAFSIFLFVKLFNKFKKKQAEKPASKETDSKEVLLLAEIRDLLTKQTGNQQ